MEEKQAAGRAVRVPIYIPLCGTPKIVVGSSGKVKEEELVILLDLNRVFSLDEKGLLAQAA